MIEFGKKEEKELRKCYSELSEVLISSIIFLNSNGMGMEYIRDLLHKTVDMEFNYVRDEIKK